MFRILILIMLLSGFILLQGASVNRVEYFFDTDPGLGNGTALAFTGNPEASVNAAIPAATLCDGLHFLHIRARDTDGKWSLMANKSFFKTASGSMPITRLEYFFDSDPGYGNGINLPFTGSNQILCTGTIEGSHLSHWLHILTVRARNTEGYWSQNCSRMLMVIPTVNPALTSVTYYFDGDTSQAITVPATPCGGDNTSTCMDLDIDPAACHILGGLHLLCVQATDAEGFISLKANKLIYYTPQSLSPLSGLQWYFTGNGADPEQVFSHNLGSPMAEITQDIALSVSHLQQDGEYQMHVYEVNSHGQKSFEQLVPFRANFTPQNVVLQINGSTLSLQWDEIPGSAYYKVKVANDPAATGNIVNVTDTQYTAPINAKAKFFQVTAVEATRDGVSSKASKEVGK